MRKSTHFLTRCGAGLLAAILLCSSLPFASAAVASFTITKTNTRRIGYGDARHSVFTGRYDGKTGEMYGLEFTPSAALQPTLVTGNTNSARNTLSTMLKSYSVSTNEQIIGGVNGGFFNAYGNAEGLQIQNGKLLSTNQYAKDAGSTGSKFYTLGFEEDGSTVYGIPHFNMQGTTGNYTFTVEALNQLPYTSHGIWLLNADYGSTAKWNTSYAANFYVLVLQQSSGSFAVNSSISGNFVTYQTYTVSEASKLKLQKGYFYLVGSKQVIDPLATALKQSGHLSIDLNETTGLWNTARTALRGGDLLIEKGALCYHLDNSIMGAYTARTVVACKEDGSVGFFAVNNNAGAENGLPGLPLVNLAETLRKRGYVTAINLDGGGSTTYCVRTSPSDGLACINDPSDGSQRGVGNGLALLCKMGVTTVIDHFESMALTVTQGTKTALSLCKEEAQVYSGLACGKLTVKSGQSITLSYPSPLSLPKNTAALSLRLMGGKGKLTAHFKGSYGTADQTVSVSGSSYKEYSFPVPEGTASLVGFTFASTAKANVYMDQLHSHTLAENEDAFAPTLTLKKTTVKGSKGTKLTFSAADNSWGTGVDTGSCIIRVGSTVTTGTTATLKSNPTKQLTKVTYEAADKSGNRTRSYGLVSSGSYKPTANFTDVKAGGWATDFINYCYQNKLLNGQTEQGKRVYKGASNMTRAEFCATLVRLKNVDPAKYKNVKLPYADLADIPKWALNYVKAAYSLGIMTGSFSGGKRYFNPNHSITRGEAAVAIEGFLPTLAGFAPKGSYRDQASIPSWCTAAITKASSYGILQGDDVGNYRYNAPITRNEIATVLTRLHN